MLNRGWTPSTPPMTARSWQVGEVLYAGEDVGLGQTQQRRNIDQANINVSGFNILRHTDNTNLSKVLDLLPF